MKRSAFGARRSALLVFAVTTVSAADGTVQFSDGRVANGLVELAQPLQVHDGKGVRSIAMDQVREVDLSPETEAMERQWRFVEPGQPKKEYFGEPYPIRHLQATVLTASGEKVVGHLTTTIAWLTADGAEDRERVTLPAKLQGKPGETLAALVYPVRLVPSAGAAATPVKLSLKNPFPKLRPAVVVVARTSLARNEAVPDLDPDSYALPQPIEPPAFVGARSDQEIRVSWPPDADAATTKLAQTAVYEAQDFLDGRKLLGVWAEGEDQLYALVLLRRVGPTTMEGPDKPWRVEVWRWKREGERLLWANRAYFFRGLAANEQGLPTVTLDRSWWTQSSDGGALKVGGGNDGR
jgi:hypothetical protein